MAYTNLDITLRVVALYLTLLVIASIYQAISPTSPHNRGEIIDHGAQLLQDAFKDLRIHYPRFDYLVQTVDQVLLQTMLMVTMRYDVNTAVNMSLGIGLVLIAIIFVLGRLAVQVTTTVFGLVPVLMLHTIWSPFSVLVGVIGFFGALVDFFCGFIEMLWDPFQSLGSALWTHSSSRRHATLVADDSSPNEDDDKPVADERQSVPGSDHTHPLAREQHLPQPEEPAPAKPAEIDSDQVKHLMQETRKELQNLYDKTNSCKKSRQNRTASATSSPIEEIVREDLGCIDGFRPISARGTKQSREAYAQPNVQSWVLYSEQRGTRDGRSESGSSSEQIKRPHRSRSTPLGGNTAPASNPAHESDESQPCSSYRLPLFPPIPPIPRISRMPRVPRVPRTPHVPRLPYMPDEPYIPDEPYMSDNHSWSKDSSDCFHISVNGQTIEIFKDGEAYKLSRNGSLDLSVNGKPVELESDGETIKIPNDGKPLKFSLDGGLLEFGKARKPTKSGKGSK
jgi:hypothetical protein